MSRKMLKVLILGAMIVSALASASSASATWTTNSGGAGGPAFSATAGATRLSVTPTGPILNCASGNRATGVLNPGNASGLGLATVTPIFGSGATPDCTVSGLAFTVSCAAAELNGASFANPVTTGTISNIDCTITIPNCSVTVTGTVPADYNETTSVLTVTFPGQALTYVATGSACTALGFAASGTRDADYTNGTGGSTAYTVVSTFKPTVTNP
jgi:hypothetical protein